MSEVGIVSIVLGVVVVCSRGALLVAPAATLRWFEGVVATNGRTRALGAVALTLGASMTWAGASGHAWSAIGQLSALPKLQRRPTTPIDPRGTAGMHRVVDG